MSHTYCSSLYHCVFSTRERRGAIGDDLQARLWAYIVGISQVEATVKYIARQREHHRKRDFQAEFLAILKQHGIEYDPRYVWG